MSKNVFFMMVRSLILINRFSFIYSSWLEQLRTVGRYFFRLKKKILMFKNSSFKIVYDCSPKSNTFRWRETFKIFKIIIMTMNELINTTIFLCHFLYTFNECLCGLLKPLLLFLLLLLIIFIIIIVQYLKRRNILRQDCNVCKTVNNIYDIIINYKYFFR